TDELCAALRGTAKALRALGRLEEASQADQETIRVWRNLAAKDPGAVEHLAGALNDWGVALSQEHRANDAIPPGEEAVRLYRKLAETQCWICFASLVLHIISSRFRDVARNDKALQAIQEAVDLRRGLAKTDPAMTPFLASSLDLLAINLSERPGRVEEALQVYDESVQLRRQEVARNLSTDNLKALRSAFLMYGKLLKRPGRYTEALRVAQEAVALFDGLVDANSSVMRELAMALEQLALELAGAGRHDDAIYTAQRATQLFRILAEKSEPHGNKELANALDHLASELHRLDGREEEAILAGKEAIALRRTLPPTDSVDSLILAQCLENLGVHLRIPRHYEESLSVAQESVDLFRKTIAANPDFGSLRLRSPENLLTRWFAHALENLAYSLSAVGRAEDAVQAASESIDLYRTCAAHIFAGLTTVDAGITARSLRGLARDLRSVGWQEEALRAQEEVVRLYGTVTPTRPALIQLRVDALRQLGKDLRVFGREEEAVRVEGEISGLEG
ncbi:hypothetical protein FB45DRAFT_759052, partial [Roridomyces roridus]